MTPTAANPIEAVTQAAKSTRPPDNRAPKRKATPAVSNASRTRSCTTMAAPLPRKMPAGSRPDSRSPSRAESVDSTVKLLCTARTTERSTAIQNNPPAAGWRAWRFGPRASPNSKSTAAANGTTWLRPTLDRASIRRSFPQTSIASRHMGGLRGRHDPAPGEVDDPVRQGAGADKLVRRQHHGGASSPRFGHDLVEEDPSVVIET